jgi:predicted CXXCH cytochrome family protein
MGHMTLMNILLLLLSLCQLAGPGKDLADAREPDCRECHSDLLEKEMMHYPAEDACDNCHESTGASHPSGDSLGFRLMDRVPELCYYCHEEPMSQSSAHGPHLRGECLACHDAHGSETRSLLMEPDPVLCLSCHKQIFRTDSTEVSNIRQLVGGRKRAHSAIALGGCMSCHKPHGSAFRALLVDSYPQEDYLPALPENFALCFLCHDPDLMIAEKTDRATGFRNGTKNLHWIHINGNKGRNCRMCHNIHGSSQAFLVEERLGFGQWEMRMNFTVEEQGGSCMPGCHGNLSYRR